MTQSTTQPGPDASAAEAEVSLSGVGRVFGTGTAAVHALADVTVEVPGGRFVVLLGASGSGKTTLLNIIGGIDTATSGSVRIRSQNLADLSDRELTDYRRTTVGFIFQFYNLVPTLTAAENIQLVADLAGAGGAERTAEMLDAVGLAERAEAFPAQLSGGEQQRIAIARALAKGPSLLLADEPTGALDLETGQSILGLLRHLNQDRGLTLFLITHNTEIARMADTVLHLSDGRITEVTTQADPAAAEDLSW